MGCLFTRSSSSDSDEPVKKEYSWDKKRNIRKEDFMLENLQDRSVVRLPDSIGGQQFLIQNLTNCNIYLLDHMAAINMDNCTNCQLVTGPVKGSVFLRNCMSCKILCACQQLRTRDCSKTDIFLFCTTQPIIEASYKMQFGCYQLSYSGLAKQFVETELELMNNSWDKVYDFTPNPDQGPNWKLAPEDTKVEDIFVWTIENGDIGGSMDIGLNKSSLPEDIMLNGSTRISVVPMVAGNRGRISEESCLILFFNQDEMSETVLDFVRQLQSQSLTLIRSNQMTLPEERVSEMFDSSSEAQFFEAGKRGAVIGMEVNGENCSQNCQNIIASTQIKDLVYISDLWQVIELYFSGIDMQM